MENLVYQVTRLPHSPDEKPLVVAITSKESAQRLVAALAEEEGRLDGYKVTAFTHPEFAFMRE
jgi:anti-sigma-K factor RskA